MLTSNLWKSAKTYRILDIKNVLENCWLTMHVRVIYARKFYWQLNLSNIGLQID